MTVNNTLFVNDGFASITSFKDGESPEVTFNMTAPYGENIKSASRHFVKESNRSLLIEDKLC